jgi:hypothetical protein
MFATREAGCITPDDDIIRRDRKGFGEPCTACHKKSDSSYQHQAYECAEYNSYPFEDFFHIMSSLSLSGNKLLFRSVPVGQHHTAKCQ